MARLKTQDSRLHTQESQELIQIEEVEAPIVEVEIPESFEVKIEPPKFVMQEAVVKNELPKFVPETTPKIGIGTGGMNRGGYGKCDLTS